MHLIGVKQEGSWDFSRWELTYPAAWDNILNGIAFVYDYYEHTEILVRGEHLDIGKSEDILKVEENGDMTIRGLSKILSVPISITFYNQLMAVDVNVAQATQEFQDTDYEKFNHSLCQYLDSIELAMHR